MIKLTRKRIIFFALAGLFIIYLFFANSIVLSLFSDNDPLRRVNRERFLNTSFVRSDVHWDLSNDFFESFIIAGWAFAEADYQEDKTAYLVLRGINSGRLHSAPLTLSIRPDVLSYFSNSELRFAGSLHGINGEFAPINLPHDIYEIYIHVQENSLEAGWARPGIRFVNSRRGLEIHESQQVPNFRRARTNNNIVYSIDSLSRYDDMLSISGWLFEWDRDTLFQDVFIEFRDSRGRIVTHSTRNVSRKDVAEHFGNPLYGYAGFSIDIPKELLGSLDDFFIDFIVMNEGRISRHRIPTELNISEFVN